LHGSFNLAIKIDRHEGPQTPVTIALLRFLYLPTKRDRLKGAQTTLTIALLINLYIAIKIDPV
jgi:hypothetical protein